MNKPKLLFATVAAASLALIALPPSGLAQVRPRAEGAPLSNRDDRTAALSPGLDRARSNALLHAKSLLPSVSVSFDELLGTPKFVIAKDGFLTGPGGVGRGVSQAAAQSIAASDPDLAVKAFLIEHAAVFGHGPEVLDPGKATKDRDVVAVHNGLRTVVWNQQLDGLAIFESTLIGNISKNGELASIGSRFLAHPDQLADAGTPNRSSLRSSTPISALAAIQAAAADLGETWSASSVTPAASTAGYLVFHTPGSAMVRMVWLPLDSTRLRLAWEVILDSHQSHFRYQALVDAENGKVWVRRSLTQFISNATYDVWTSDSPSPFSPGWPTPNSAQPPLTNRVLVTLPALDTNASPSGWIPDGGNTTTGNNADAFLDRNFDGLPDQPRPTGNPARTFDFPQDLTQDPTNYEAASTVQMFYWMNYYHDKLYNLGFTEAAGNYQDDNFGRGGFGGDHIIGYVQAGADLGIADNAFFVPAPDGFNGQVAMFIWDGSNPNRDGSLDTDVVFHELTHGTSERLVGGGVGISALQPAGMGEGWSDFYALSLASSPSDDPDAVYASGGYVTYQLFGLSTFANYYFGVRHYPYCTDTNKNPFTFKDIDPTQISPHTGVPFSPLYSPFDAQEASEVHHQGEVWCMTLWDARANLVHKYGGFTGNQLMLQLVTDAMKLSPANPTFLQARDAIILADRVDNAGQDIVELWRAFAKRGMGASAVAPSANTTTGVIEAFDLPGLQIDQVTLSGGNGNGVVDPNECNSLTISLFNEGASTATDVSGRLSTTTPGVLVTAPTSGYPDTASGATNANSTFFKISTAPDFVCGTPIDFSLLVKSDTETRTNTFRLTSGVAGSPIRYDTNLPVPIPDGDPNGASSLITVSNFPGALAKVTVAVHITHTFDSDLTIELVSPDNVTNVLSANNGDAGQNFGNSCLDSSRTIFDDSATNPISGGTAPFIGTFAPDQPLSRFNGKSGAAVNGTWQLHVIDGAFLDVGTIQCWSLMLSPAVCTDGGGPCPGVDLAIGMTAAPEPVFVQSNLVYTINITNFGPNLAKNVVISQTLPQGVSFVSATISQGNISQSGGLVTANVGTLPIGGTATALVTVKPSTTGAISSTAVVSSSDTENDPSNNSATVLTHVNPPFADMALGLSAAPNPALVGQTLTYTASVTNNGPATATNVIVTATIPISVSIVSAIPSRGTASINGNVVTANIGTLTNGAVATVIVQTVPVIQGTVVASASVTSGQVDPVPGNNFASVSTSISPAADLALGLLPSAISVVRGSNLVYTLSVTNFGPTTASGVMVNDSLPFGVTLLSSNASKGSIIVSNSTVIASLGNLANGETATITLVIGTAAIPTNVQSLVDSATVSAAEADPVLANNARSVSVSIGAPFVSFSIANVQLTAESVSPPNGVVDPGENVTANFFLQNTGNVPNINSGLVVSMLATNGVSSPSGSQNLGVIGAGFALPASFSFTGNGTNGGSIVANLLLQFGTNSQILTYTFQFPKVASFANTNRIDIPRTTQDQLQPGPAAPYPSTIAVSGVTGVLGRVTVTLSNLNHTFPHDINLLLVGPTGQKTLLMSDAADGPGVSAANVTFDDFAPAPIPGSGQLVSGSYQLSGYDPSAFFTNPAPAGPYGSSLSPYLSLNPNGNWSLYAYDDTQGDFGYVGGGWSISFTTETPVNQIANLSASAVSSPASVLVGGTVTNTFTVTNAGPAAASVVWVTNTVSSSSVLLSIANSAGTTFASDGNKLSANLGLIPSGASRTVTIVVSPTVQGTMTNSIVAVAASGELDIASVDNSADAVFTANLPSADLVLTNYASAAVVTAGANTTVTIGVTNLGLQNALSVIVSNPIPSGFTLLSSNSSSGPSAVSVSSGAVMASLGTILPGSNAWVTLVLKGVTAGSYTNVSRVFTGSTDPVSSNNVSSISLQVNPPAPLILPGGALLVSEGNQPSNGSIDSGEMVTVALYLTNSGTANSTNLTATLLANAGVINPSGPRNYGTLVAGGAAVSNYFTFTAGSPANGQIQVVLQLADAGGYAASVTNIFYVPGVIAGSNTSTIAIPDHGPASPFPSVISISGVTGVVQKVTVTLNGLTHSFPRDIDALLVAPSGQKIMLMGQCGGGHSVSGINLTFDDSAFSGLSDTAQIVSGTYKPTDFDPSNALPAPAPVGPVLAALSSLNGISPNGNWSLYVFDGSAGDSGAISGGWSVAITVANPINPVVNLILGMTVNPAFVAVGKPLTYTMTLTNVGPVTATNVNVRDTLPAGLTLVSSNTSAGTIVKAGSTVILTNVSLAPAAGLTATLTVTPAVAGTVINTAVAASAQIDLDALSNTAQASTTVFNSGPAKVNLTPLGAQQFQITITGDPGQGYQLQASSNLVNWVPVSTGTTAPNGTLKFSTSTAARSQYYRSVRLP